MRRDGDFVFRPAGPGDEADLRRLLASTPMPGALTVTFEREPDYFLGCSVTGHHCDVIIARHEPTGDLAGVLCRAVRPLFINGIERPVANIGQVRIPERYRGLGLLERGLPLLLGMSSEGLLHYGVIAAGNARAQRALVDKGFPGIPMGTPGPGITTLGIILRRPKRPLVGGVEAASGSAGELDEIVGFLRRHGRRRQFFPAYRVEDFTDGVTERGFAPEGFVVARRCGEIAGVMGLWDQSAYKQTIVQSYGPTLRLLRRPYGLLALVAGAQKLPNPGDKIDSVFASFVCVADDDTAVMRCLLRETYNRATRAGFAHLMIGLGDDDPLLRIAKKYASITYRSRVFFGALSEGPEPETLDAGPAYVEIATL